MDFTLIQSLWSIVVLITFLGIIWWAYSSKRKAAFDEAARLPFEDEPSDNSQRSDSATPDSPKKPAE